jgi:hypothetical protein
MKGGQNLRELQQKKNSEEATWVVPRGCHICGKMLKGSYGQTTIACGTVWSCSPPCEKEVQQLRKEFYSATAVPPTPD